MKQSSFQIRTILRIARLIAVVMLSLFSPPWVHPQAQSTALAQIRVVTHDDASKPIPEVLVQITKDGASVASAKSNDKGETEFTLSPGTYDLNIEKSGF